MATRAPPGLRAVSPGHPSLCQGSWRQVQDGRAPLWRPVQHGRAPLWWQVQHGRALCGFAVFSLMPLCKIVAFPALQVVDAILRRWPEDEAEKSGKDCECSMTLCNAFLFILGFFLLIFFAAISVLPFVAYVVLLFWLVV